MTAVRIIIENASPSWSLIMQSGVGVDCVAGVSAARLLLDEFGIAAEDMARVDAILLDGMPVDDPDAAVVPDGSRLALAGGLPGIAGLAMKRGSAVRALRGGITHDPSRQAAREPAPGRITLLLYSLAIELLAPRFLRRGVFAAPEQILRYARFAPDDLCDADGQTMPAERLAAFFADRADSEYFLRADIPQG